MTGSQKAPALIDVDTPLGPARWHVTPPTSSARAPSVQLLLGHGAGGGVGAPDLAVLAAELPAWGVEVARFEQPWRVAGRKVAGSPVTLDRAWVDACPVIRRPDVPLVVGGRSAGARVACRTAIVCGATGVLALAFPLHPPGRPDKTRSDELPRLPLLIAQGGRDQFGTASELRAPLADQHDLLEIPGADHSLRVGRGGPLTQSEANEVLVLGVRRWLADLIGNRSRRFGC
jgi:predicted alpha/beta-hydrolase family hydrolase